jgi:hypothetical protein
MHNTLILLREAPKPPADATPDDMSADPTGDADAEMSVPPDTDEPPVEDTPPDEGTDETAVDDTEDDDDEEDGLGDELNDDAATGDESDPIADRLRRERLYDSIADAQRQCTKLITSTVFILDRCRDPVAMKFASRAKQILDETDEQCSIVRSKFADLGYERARDLYSTIRERVSAVAEIIKHVIDGDDDFQKSDSGNPQRNGSTPKQGRGRSE